MGTPAETPPTTRAISFARAIREVSWKGLDPAAQQSVPVPSSLQTETGTCSGGTRSRAGKNSLFLRGKCGYFPFGKFRGIVEQMTANISRSVKQ